MARHRSLTGPSAIHPFAFISDTDPSLDAANGVGPGKAWVLESAPYTLKVRNEANSGWITVLGAPAAALNLDMVSLTVAWTLDDFIAYDLDELDFVELEYVP